MCVSRVVKIVLVSIICAMANVASATELAYYKLNEDPSITSTALDSSPGGSSSGTYIVDTGTGPTSVASVNPTYGTAIHFDTSSTLSYINVPSLSGAPTQNSALTYAAWINPDTVQLNQ